MNYTPLRIALMSENRANPWTVKFDPPDVTSL